MAFGAGAALATRAAVSADVICCESTVPKSPPMPRALRPMNETPVLAAEMGSDAGMIGAAAMARAELDRGEG